MIRASTIYAIVDDRDDCRVRYIGRTMCSLKERLQNHHYGDLAVANWIRANSKNLKIFPLEIVPFVPWAAGNAERKWIEYYRSIGHDLFNIWPYTQERNPQ